MRPPKSRFLSLLIVLIALAPFALARDNREYTQFGRDIRIAPGEKAADLTCFRCSIYVSGQVGGEVTTFGGNIVIEPGGSVGGDLTSFLGDVRLSESTRVGGNLTTFGGSVRRQPGGTVGGDTTTFEGQGWMWLILGVPVLLLAGIVALIVRFFLRPMRQALTARSETIGSARRSDFIDKRRGCRQWHSVIPSKYPRRVPNTVWAPGAWITHSLLGRVKPSRTSLSTSISPSS